MKTRVTVIPEDNYINVDGVGAHFDFDCHIEGLHALQWLNGKGDLEFNEDGKHRNQAVVDYDTEVQPFVDAFDQFIAEIEAASVPTYEGTLEAKLATLRASFNTASGTAYLTSSVGFDINANDTARENIEGLIATLEEASEESVSFRTYDNRFHTVTLDDLKIMRLEVIRNSQFLYQAKWTLEEKINAATTIEELDAIELSADVITDLARTLQKGNE